MTECHFIKSFTVLIHLCVLNQRQDLFHIIEDILREFLNSLDGLIFLANQTATPNGLLRALFLAVIKGDDDIHCWRLSFRVSRKRNFTESTTILSVHN